MEQHVLDLKVRLLRRDIAKRAERDDPTYLLLRWSGTTPPARAVAAKAGVIARNHMRIEERGRELRG